MSNKISHIVTDNASNMITAFSLAGFSTISVSDSLDSSNDEPDDGLYEYVNEHVSCFAHTLQLVIKDGFKQLV